MMKTSALAFALLSLHVATAHENCNEYYSIEQGMTNKDCWNMCQETGTDSTKFQNSCRRPRYHINGDGIDIDEDEDCFTNQVYGYSSSGADTWNLVDLQNVIRSTDTAAECQDICRQTPNCFWFHFNVQDDNPVKKGTCVLKSKDMVDHASMINTEEDVKREDYDWCNAQMGFMCQNHRYQCYACHEAMRCTFLSMNHLAGPAHCTDVARPKCYKPLPHESTTPEADWGTSTEDDETTAAPEKTTPAPKPTTKPTPKPTTPTTQAPTTTKPTTQAPTTTKPTTQAPTTTKPTTQAPTTTKPTTQAPTTTKPTTHAPTTTQPPATTQAPVTEAPATQPPATEAPATTTKPTTTPAPTEAGDVTDATTASGDDDAVSTTPSSPQHDDDDGDDTTAAADGDDDSTTGSTTAPAGFLPGTTAAGEGGKKTGIIIGAASGGVAAAAALGYAAFTMRSTPPTVSPSDLEMAPEAPSAEADPEQSVNVHHSFYN